MSSVIYPGQRQWSRDGAAALLDMSGQLADFKATGDRQLDAAVALHRMLLKEGCAYLADEVGMGKTYVALAVVALFRHLQPGFRVLYLAPSQNVLRKWHERELPAFIRGNVRQPDLRVRGPGGLAPAASVACPRVDEWARAALTHPAALDVFLPLSALSFHLSGSAPADWARRVTELADSVGAHVGEDLSALENKDEFKALAASLVNRVIPRYDLVVIDEAHLLKGGAGASASDRARFLARVLGAPGFAGQRRFGGALLLSGTPFDRDLRQLARQFELFAPLEQSEPSFPPHRCIRALAAQREAGATWDQVQRGLRPYMVRRVQKLDIGGRSLSRNQYRREWRAEAGISLADDSSPEALRQRLFTAVVQKRLIEHLDGENEGRFPLAMFSSWEAYALPRPAGRGQSESAARPADGEDEAGQPLPGGEVLDVGKDGVAAPDMRAVDGALMEDLVGSYREVFGTEPPHPKLEREAQRLGREAFAEGAKQLVFVRRLKSVDDLYARLNQAYDSWLGDYLRQEGMPGAPAALLAARRAAARGVADPAGLVDTPAGAGVENDNEAELPPRGDTLFSWFFRGTLDAAGEQFVRTHDLPAPRLLRERLRDPARFEAIIGELDWRGFVMMRCPALPEVPWPEVAARAASVRGAASALGRYRRLQLAWVDCLVARLPAAEARCFLPLREHLLSLQLNTAAVEAERMDAGQAESLLEMPTLGLALYRKGFGPDVLPAWEKAWVQVWACRDQADRATAAAAAASLRELDLQREILFALLRLDHPFIDLYLGWLRCWRDDARAAASALVERVVAVCARPAGQFGSASILRSLAEAWTQIAKTNFAELLTGSARLERSGWRSYIQQQLSPFEPVEWASGQNTGARSAIARRFRMPGYPMVLVATSVLQEGEDLHVCCDRVTHFGISGSPIGIEQKNGRVDRIGSRAQRRLLGGLGVDEAGIQVRFPHLAESLEWYQIRDLSQSINDYLLSLHQVGTRINQEETSLAGTMADGHPIPALPTAPLDSPFEPQLEEITGGVAVAEVQQCFDAAEHILEHANALLAEIAAESGFVAMPGRPDRYHHPLRMAQLSLQPAHMTGELTVVASRRLLGDELPDWMAAGHLADGQPDLDAIRVLVADPRHRHMLRRGDDGLELHVEAACFARGEAELSRDELRDLLGRIGMSTDYTPPVTASDALLGVLRDCMRLDGGADLEWAPGADAARQSVSCRRVPIQLELWQSWVVASRIVEADPAPQPANVRWRTLNRNGTQGGPDFFLASNGQIHARLTHPVADLGAAELCCMLRELAAATGNGG
ncbi:MAG: hypothetical protein JSR69_20550 [Proteobacteria bacterium]|nr:hypothetical protein [Pseudomonadota bacterium]